VKEGWHGRAYEDFEGDTIYAESRVLAKRESQSRPQMGIVRIMTTGFNQEGVGVIEFIRMIMVYKRGHTPPHSAAESRALAMRTMLVRH